MCPGNYCHGQAWDIGHLTKGLQAAVKSIQWTYSVYWTYCPYSRLLKWGGGYYNGRMNSTKMVDVSLQRTLKLRELYECLCSGGEGEEHPWKPFSALSPEDLTDTEWFYLVSMTFSFGSSIGLPGQALAKGSPLWLFGANEADSKVFKRSLLAKSAGIQTVICIPLMDGVLELGITDLVHEDHDIVLQAKRLFLEQYLKPELLEYSSTSPQSLDKRAQALVMAAHSPQPCDMSLESLTPEFDGDEIGCVECEVDEKDSV